MLVCCAQVLKAAAAANGSADIIEALREVGVYLSFGPMEKQIMFFVTSVCARRPGAAARMERRRGGR